MNGRRESRDREEQSKLEKIVKFEVEANLVNAEFDRQLFQ